MGAATVQRFYLDTVKVTEWGGARKSAGTDFGGEGGEAPGPSRTSAAAQLRAEVRGRTATLLLDAVERSGAPADAAGAAVRPIDVGVRRYTGYARRDRRRPS
jgi:hypothetical protein